MDRIIEKTRELCEGKSHRINKREIISFDLASEILHELWPTRNSMITTIS
jgi:hypothetical protein